MRKAPDLRVHSVKFAKDEARLIRAVALRDNLSFSGAMRRLAVAAAEQTLTAHGGIR